MRRKNTILIILIIYVILLFIGATISIPENTINFKGLDKIVHFIQFFIFAIILLKFLQYHECKNIYVWSLIIGIILIIISEASQILINYRQFTIYDLIANFLGFISGMVTFKWILFKL